MAHDGRTCEEIENELELCASEALRAQAELRRLRDESPYVPCSCGRQIYIPALTELVELRAMRERARHEATTPDYGPEARVRAATARRVLEEDS